MKLKKIYVSTNILNFLIFIDVIRNRVCDSIVYCEHDGDLGPFAWCQTSFIILWPTKKGKKIAEGWEYKGQ